MLTIIIMRIPLFERQKTAEPVVSKEQAITASLKGVLSIIMMKIFGLAKQFYSL
jgi:hypothetical protein